jgi:hypothetical protein
VWHSENNWRQSEKNLKKFDDFFAGIVLYLYGKNERINGTGSVPFEHVNLITARLLFMGKVCTATVSCRNLPVLFLRSAT